MNLLNSSFPAGGLLAFSALFALTFSSVGSASEEVEMLFGEAKPEHTIYVDAVGGDDANSGASPAEAIRTLNHAQDLLNEFPLDEQAALRLARGSVWREHYEKNPKDRGIWPPYAFGRNNLTVVAYGEGEKPVISGFEILPNADFRQEDAKTYPNVWSIQLTPPEVHLIKYHDNYGVHSGVVVDGEMDLYRIYTPIAPGQKLRDIAESQPGVETEEDALRILNDNPGTYYVRDDGDGVWTYFLNSGSDPRTDGRLYEYRTRPAQFAARPGNIWKDFRLTGSTHRDGIGGGHVQLEGVEFVRGYTHHMLLHSGHFRDVLSEGYFPEKVPDGIPFNWKDSNTYSLFHTHGSNSTGLVYDNCTARNGGIAFFDHKADANRPFIVIRDCTTANLRSLFGHGACTKKSWMVGHQHESDPQFSDANMGSFTAGENFVEDSIFRFHGTGRGQWHKGYGGHMRMRNSVIHATGESPRVILSPDGGPDNVTDWEYENVTLILDLRGESGGGEMAAAPVRNEDAKRGKWTLKNCVVAVIGDEGQIRESAEGSGRTMSLGALKSVDLVLDNCVLTYIENLPESSGVEGEDFVFARAEEIFAGDPREGDYSLRPDGVAASRGAGYEEGRTPVFRPVADEIARTLPEYMGDRADAAAAKPD